MKACVLYRAIDESRVSRRRSCATATLQWPPSLVSNNRESKTFRTAKGKLGNPPHSMQFIVSLNGPRFRRGDRKLTWISAITRIPSWCLHPERSDAFLSLTHVTSYQRDVRFTITVTRILNDNHADIRGTKQWISIVCIWHLTTTCLGFHYFLHRLWQSDLQSQTFCERKHSMSIVNKVYKFHFAKNPRFFESIAILESRVKVRDHWNFYCRVLLKVHQFASPKSLKKFHSREKYCNSERLV